MTETSPFAALLTAANAGSHPRAPGQWTPTACQVWRDAGPDAGCWRRRSPGSWAPGGWLGPTVNP
jgi:hypothetical protein